MTNVATVIAMFNAATNRRERNRAMYAAARLAPADQLLIVDAAIKSHHLLTLKRGDRLRVVRDSDDLALDRGTVVTVEHVAGDRMTISARDVTISGVAINHPDLAPAGR
jgi:hypothetical protein